MSDPSLRSIGHHLSKLEVLSVRGCVRVTRVGVGVVVRGCRWLKAMDVSQCRNLDLSGINAEGDLGGRVRFRTGG